MRRLLTILACLPILLLPGAAHGALPPAVKVIAHRCNGGSYTEGTQMACVKAAATGAETLDVDLRWLQTGHPVILHDPHLGVFGAPTVLIKNVSVTQATQYLSPSRNNLTTLTQFRDTVLATGTDAVIEPKIVPTATQWTQITAAFDSIRPRVIVESFDPNVVAAASARGYQTMLLSADDITIGQVPEMTDLAAWPAAKVDAAHVAALNSHGVQVWCWAADDPTAWRACVDAGVTGIITDRHVAAQTWLNSQ